MLTWWWRLKNYIILLYENRKKRADGSHSIPAKRNHDQTRHHTTFRFVFTFSDRYRENIFNFFFSVLPVTTRHARFSNSIPVGRS